MLRACLFLVTAIGVSVIAVDHATAQIGFSVTQQNGVVTGGGFLIGGVITNGGTGVRLGVSASTSQLIAIPTFTFQNGVARNGGGNGGVNMAMNRNPVPGVDQFVAAAGRFDQDRNNRLDRKELTQVANAVVTELKQYYAQRSGQASPQTNQAAQSDASPDVPSTEDMVKAFVQRSMTFDMDKDDALNATETKHMASALLRSLGFTSG